MYNLSFNFITTHVIWVTIIISVELAGIVRWVDFQRIM